MSLFDSPSRKGKWHCSKCNTWCMDTVKVCSFCSKPKPQPQSPPQKPPQTSVDKSGKGYNDLRCTASEIIRILYEAKEVNQLNLLKIQVEAALKPLGS
jgi:hypothetical protein